jgi:hypothetical protein
MLSFFSLAAILRKPKGNQRPQTLNRHRFFSTPTKTADNKQTNKQTTFTSLFSKMAKNFLFSGFSI